MKKIFRFLGSGALLAALLAIGAVATFAQDPCADADGETALSDKVRELFPKTDLESQKAKIEAGKSFLEKYGSCDSAKEFSDYLKPAIPKWEETYKKTVIKVDQDALTGRFNTAFTGKNWDVVYASGKELLNKYPDDFRDVELVLGSIGLDETQKSPRVTTWNDDTLKFARQSIQDLEGGKTFKTYGVSIKNGPNFQYKNKEDALGWMNYTIGYITSFDKKNKKEGSVYLYKATQLNSDTKTNPLIYDSIGSYYFDEVNRHVEQIQVLDKSRLDTDPEDVKNKKIEDIKNEVGLLNGSAERALDAYSRAYKLATAPGSKAAKPYQEKLYKNLQDAYNLRFKKLDGLDAWISSAVTKPMPDPSTAITPVIDPEPTTTTTTTGAPAAATPTPTPAAVKPVTVTKPAASTKPGSTATVKSTVSPVETATTAKPKAVVKKPAVKKKGTR